MDATQRWRELLRRPEADVPLDEAALIVSAHATPGLDIGSYLSHLDRLALEAGGGGTVAVIDLLFRRLGLRGDTETYDDPRNSYLDQVLERGVGIPISLSILLIEVGRRCGASLEGVGMPGHFLVRDRDDPDMLIDAFDAGRRLDEHACRQLFRAVAGPALPFDASVVAATGTRGILARVLANLDRSFRDREDLPSRSWVTELWAEIPDQPVSVRVQLAAVMNQLGRYDRAADLLERAAEDGELPEAAATEIGRRAIASRARLN